MTLIFHALPTDRFFFFYLFYNKIYFHNNSTTYKILKKCINESLIATSAVFFTRATTQQRIETKRLNNNSHLKNTLKMSCI